MTRRRLGYSDTAVELGVTVTWLQRHIKELPHKKLGNRRVYFTDADIERIDELAHREPESGPLARPVVVPETLGGHPLAHLKPLPSRGDRATSSSVPDVARGRTAAQSAKDGIPSGYDHR
ncbi:DNA-binding protein [Streptomyces sp. NPDC008079]|uniref:DNA-binding protein n=1 Tax=Streptomyces sp. NPDC008079 TaxID=3364806 RepID=UPI0036F0C864